MGSWVFPIRWVTWDHPVQTCLLGDPPSTLLPPQDLFKLVHLGTPVPLLTDLFKLAHLGSPPPRPIGKQAVGLRLKGLPVFVRHVYVIPQCSNYPDKWFCTKSKLSISEIRIKTRCFLVTERIISLPTCANPMYDWLQKFLSGTSVFADNCIPLFPMNMTSSIWKLATEFV